VIAIRIHLFYWSATATAHAFNTGLPPPQSAALPFLCAIQLQLLVAIGNKYTIEAIMLISLSMGTINLRLYDEQINKLFS
jgi:hypothetical protein